MTLSRRQFLWGAAGSAVLLPWHQRPLAAQGQLFQHGVASGDPLADRVMLWTRLTPSTSADPSAVRAVDWLVASDERLARVVARGSVTTNAERDFTVKVDAGGLQPGRTYYYVFLADGQRSPIGRTKTLPSRATRVRFAVVSCSNYPAGFFNPYRCITNRDDLDAVLHLGDYIYEFANGIYGDGAPLGRIPEPRRETITLTDYRLRYATYRADPDLQGVHARHPFIVVWDDHELANDAWLGGAANHDASEGDWPARRTAAWRAYCEWMPVRESDAPDIQLYRNFRFGGLADLVMLDTRGLRDRQVPGKDVAQLRAPGRSLLGQAQEDWMFRTLRDSQRAATPWRLLGQQVMFSRLSYPGRPVPMPDTWDGYQAARDRVLEFLTAEKVRDIAILSGDVHSSWAFDVAPNPWDGYAAKTGTGSVAVELVTPAVSSPPLFIDKALRDTAQGMRFALPHLKYLEGEHRGYLLVDITRQRLQADWYHVPTVLERTSLETRSAGFVCERGASRLLPA